MEKNVGGRDRQLRFVAGTILLLVAVLTLLIDPFSGPETNGLVAVITLALAIALIFTAETGRCIVNRALGRDTHEH